MADSIRQMQFLWPATCFCGRMIQLVFCRFRSSGDFSGPTLNITHRDLDLHLAHVQVLFAVHEQPLQGILRVILCTFDEENNGEATCELESGLERSSGLKSEVSKKNSMILIQSQIVISHCSPSAITSSTTTLYRPTANDLPMNSLI